MPEQPRSIGRHARSTSTIPDRHDLRHDGERGTIGEVPGANFTWTGLRTARSRCRHCVSRQRRCEFRDRCKCSRGWWRLRLQRSAAVRLERSPFVLAPRSWGSLMSRSLFSCSSDGRGTPTERRRPMTQKLIFPRNRKLPPPRNPERHRLRTLNDFQDELLDDRSDQDFFTRFFNRFFGNPDNQQQRFLYRFDPNGPARTRCFLFELYFSKAACQGSDRRQPDCRLGCAEVTDVRRSYRPARLGETESFNG